ncbi:MAG TPA: hypothetical protein VIH59_02420 [Candidatus Tectomicrobia bacterium]|jgi:hypothetical protein
MATHPEERLQAVLAWLPPHAQAEVLDLAEFLVQRQGTPPSQAPCLSEAEHARIVAVLDAVVALSQEGGPPVRHRDHNIYLYRER